MKNICVIGGGAAGMMAAYAASLSENTNVHLFEKNGRLGRKLLITGKGRCNVTNMGDMDDYMENIPHNASFLYSAFSSFNNIDLIGLLEENGIKTKIERGARVFPESDRALDVVDAFAGMLKKRGISVKCNSAAKSAARRNGGFTISFDCGETFDADALIIATGGLSYPQTGSTGDGYKLANLLGHSVTELYPSLVGLNVLEKYIKHLAGLSLKNVSVSITDLKGTKLYEDFGEMLFTHTGVSGPVILSASARIAKRLGGEQFPLYINFKPALDEKKLDLRLLRDFNKYKNRDLANAMDDLLPKSAIPLIIDAAGISPQKKVNEITKSERKALAGAISAFRLTIVGAEGFENAIITCGGVNTNEINPKTMESKIVKSLFFCGELIDVDAYTGGFNLQIAFSTGFLAGKSAADA